MLEDHGQVPRVVHVGKVVQSHFTSGMSGAPMQDIAVEAIDAQCHLIAMTGRALVDQHVHDLGVRLGIDDEGPHVDFVIAIEEFARETAARDEQSGLSAAGNAGPRPLQLIQVGCGLSPNAMGENGGHAQSPATESWKGKRGRAEFGGRRTPVREGP